MVGLKVDWKVVVKVVQWVVSTAANSDDEKAGEKVELSVVDSVEHSAFDLAEMKAVQMA